MESQKLSDIKRDNVLAAAVCLSTNKFLRTPDKRKHCKDVFKQEVINKTI